MLSVVASQVTPGNTGQTIRARIVGAKNVPITQATLSTLKAVVTDLSLEALTVGSGAVASHTLTISAVVFNTLQQNDPQWLQDSVNQLGADNQYGYNLLYTVPAADFANSGDMFQVDLVATPATGEPFRIKVKIPTSKVYG